MQSLQIKRINGGERMLAEIESYSPYEKMNMLRTGARVRRLKTLYSLKIKGIVLK